MPLIVTENNFPKSFLFKDRPRFNNTFSWSVIYYILFLKVPPPQSLFSDQPTGMLQVGRRHDLWSEKKIPWRCNFLAEMQRMSRRPLYRVTPRQREHW